MRFLYEYDVDRGRDVQRATDIFVRLVRVYYIHTYIYVCVSVRACVIIFFLNTSFFGRFSLMFVVYRRAL